MSIANLAESVGEPKIVVTTSHIERSLKVIRDFATDHALTEDSEARNLRDMDGLTFDEVMLAATLLATVERASNSSGRLWLYVTPLLAEGAGGRGWPKGILEDWQRARSERDERMWGGSVGKKRRTRAKADAKIARAA